MTFICMHSFSIKEEMDFLITLIDFEYVFTGIESFNVW